MVSNSSMPADKPKRTKSIEQIAADVGLYPVEAFEFVQRGLEHTVEKLHQQTEAGMPHHVSGRELSVGLRELALSQWGLLARTVLQRWNITRTDDFGRIVFALVENGWLSKTDEDSVEDFKNVFDFRTAFDLGYRIECKS